MNDIQSTCPVCGMKFLHGVEYGWTLVEDGVRVLYCSYSCMRATENKNKPKRQNPMQQLVTLGGRTQTVKEWCNEMGLQPGTVRARIVERHYSPEYAITRPLVRPKCYEWHGRMMTLPEIAKKACVNYRQLSYYVHTKGANVGEAVNIVKSKT